jgi:hypothetical protein
LWEVLEEQTIERKQLDQPHAIVIVIQMKQTEVICSYKSNSDPTRQPMQEESSQQNQFQRMHLSQFVTISILIQIEPRKVNCTNQSSSHHNTSTDAGRIISTKPVSRNVSFLIHDNLDPVSNLTEESGLQSRKQF